ncbi:MAG: VOC family protein [Acidimicrobiia bacterium]
MTITNAFASLAVHDLEVARPWYEQLLGPASQPMPEVLEWTLGRGGGLQVYRLPERAGQGSCTMIVDDIDDIAGQLRKTGLAPDAEPVRSEQTDTVMVKDPDGNSIAPAVPKDPTLAR